MFKAPLSGRVTAVNERLRRDCGLLDEMPYGENWICMIEGDGLDDELPQLKIGNSAITLFQQDIERFQQFVDKDREEDEPDEEALFIGAIGRMDDAHWNSAVKEFFDR